MADQSSRIRPYIDAEVACDMNMALAPLHPIRRMALATLLLVLTGLALPPARAQPLPGPFVLSRPAGDGPFPAVILLHDCSGLGPRSSGAPWRWSTRLNRLGYVTLWPDSFSSRGYPDGVCTETARAGVTPDQRAADVHAALAYLGSLPFVDRHRIALMGGSHGGSSTLATIARPPEASPAHLSAARPAIAAAIALYPGCARSYGAWKVVRRRPAGTRIDPVPTYAGAFEPISPLLILIGELDDWTPAQPCRELASRARSADQPVELVVYPGAHHAFDSAAPVAFRKERRNPNAEGGRGATTGGNPEAWKDAEARARPFSRSTSRRRVRRLGARRTPAAGCEDEAAVAISLHGKVAGGSLATHAGPHARAEAKRGSDFLPAINQKVLTIRQSPDKSRNAPTP
ncbi:MAG: dienelactone hydrolase family protein [Lautropia sp.]